MLLISIWKYALYKLANYYYYYYYYYYYFYISDFQSFLVTCGYVLKVIPNYAHIVEPLRKLTQKEQKWSWGNEQTKTFKVLKEALSGALVLACFCLDAPTYVVTDASPNGLGAILLQDKGAGEHKPIAHIS